MLEEVPTEDLQPAEAVAAVEKPDGDQQANKTEAWDDQDYEYFFGDYLDDGYRPRAAQEVKELPPIENTLSTATSLSDHLLWQLSMQTDDPLMKEIGSAIIGNLDDDGYLVASFDELAAMGPWPVPEVERALQPGAEFRPDRRRRAGPPGVPAASAAPPRARGHADRKDRHRTFAAAAEPSGARNRPQAGDVDRRPQGTHRDHPEPRSKAWQPVQPDAVAVRHPRRLRRQSRRSVCGRTERGRAAADADQPRLPPAAGQDPGAQRRNARLREGQVPVGALADQVGRAASEDDSQGGHEHHQLPAGVSRPRHRASPAAGAAGTWPTTSACTNRR